ncbi:hypothetical protein BC826DRAFT_1014493 [Russula brevipes]|nr:hypothetical protein BC826DRAFT_1014493 [Russula brevipes]
MGSALALHRRPSLDSRTQLPPGHPLQQVQVQRQALAQGQGKPNSLQPAPLFNAGGPLARPSTSQSMGTQMTGPSSSGGLQSQGGAMVNSSTPGSVLTQPMGTMQMRRPTQEEVAIAKRWVDEQKRLAFSRDFDGVAGYPTIPESDIQEYHRSLERLDQVLASMEKYIHLQDVVQRMFTMMASAKVQLEELKKPNPRYVLELHTIRGMIQEADNMDKSLKSSCGAPSVPQPPPQPPSAATPTPQAQPAMSQGDESAPSPEGAMSDPKDPFDEEVAIGWPG